MSRIFEALQHAEEERLQRNKSAEELVDLPEDERILEHRTRVDRNRA